MYKNIKIVKDTWNQWSDTWYEKYRTDEVISKIINKPESAFHHTTYMLIKSLYPSLVGKKILVPSSGDNHVVFAFHLMGAKVTSCDISEKQLENASVIAEKHSWKIEFICDDTMELSKIKSEEYDFVYTSNGVHVWINDLASMYGNICRVLKNNGSYIMYDIHPFTRPFGDFTDKITVVQPYDSTGPFGEVPTYTWRMQDIINAILISGLNIKHIEEMFAEYGTYWYESSGGRDALSKEEIDKLYDWQQNPLAAIPQWLSIYASK
jgi:SAM-dependent methyltransferase